MAAYLKERDPNHLVTVGLEGFWGADTQEAHDFNPLNGPDGELVWTSLTGQNFTAQHASPHIDFCGAHYWPDVWVRTAAASCPLPLCCFGGPVAAVLHAWLTGLTACQVGLPDRHAWQRCTIKAA